MSGWLDLTQQGLSPCQKHQASLGALTLGFSGGAPVLTVPKRSVITEQGRTFVFVFDGGERFERRAVVLGSEGQDYNEVRSGLQAGERVVTEGIYQLRSTQPG